MLLFTPVGQDLEKRIVWLRNSAFFRTAIDVLLNVGDIRLCVCVCVRVCVCVCVYSMLANGYTMRFYDCRLCRLLRAERGVLTGPHVICAISLLHYVDVCWPPGCSEGVIIALSTIVISN